MEDERQGTGLVSSLPLAASESTAPDACTCCENNAGPGGSRNERWLRDSRYARWLAWASLAWMTAEGAIGLVAGITAGSIALTGWALGSVVEGLASIIVVWRFTGARTMSESAERQAQRGIAISFWLLAPYIAIQAVLDLAGRHPAATTILGIALTASSVVIMPALGITKQRLGQRLGSGATAGEGIQNLMCAAQAAAVLVGLAVVAIWPAGWPIDPVIALGIAAWSAWEGRQAWRGDGCC